MKKAVIIFVIALLLLPLILQLVLAQNEVPGLPSALQPGNVEKTAASAEKTVQTAQTKWDYLSQEWKKILLENKYTSALNSFFTKISFVFVFLFGQPYSLSLTLLFIIIFWFYFFLMFGGIFKNYSSFSPAISYVLAFALSVVASQQKIFEKLASFFIWLIFKDKPWWLSLIFGIGILLCLIVIFIIIKVFGKSVEEARKKKKKEEAEEHMENITKFGKKLNEGFEHGGGI